jgi:3-oxoacyl-[acyl-carrier protein] reductase
MRLKDKVAIVTGSAKGIGRATALAFAKEGAKLVINARSSVEEGEKVVKEIKKLGSEAVFIQADISKPKDISNLFEKTLGVYNRVDILVNNAGVHHPKNYTELTFEDWEKIFHTNVIGLFLCCQQAARIMLKQKKGKIINIASIRGLGHSARPGNVDYSASKAAVINITKSLAKALAPQINVNAVAPGPTNTQLNKWTEKDLRYSYLGRLIQPEEIAKTILFLASSDADIITGEILVVDGGYNLK